MNHSPSPSYISNIIQLLGVIIVLISLTSMNTAFAKDTLIAPIHSKIDTLDPNYNNFFDNRRYAGEVFQMLNTSMNNIDTGHFRLAESITNIDPLTWQIKLKKNVLFHDGKLLTTSDVKDSIERIWQQDDGSKFKHYFTNIDSIKIIDDLNLQMITKKPDKDLPLLLSDFYITRKADNGSFTKADFDSGKAVIGTGNLQFVKKYDDGSILFKRFKQEDPSKKNFPFVLFKFSRKDQQLKMFLNGELDLLFGLNIDELNEMKTKNDANIYLSPYIAVRVLQLDTSRDQSAFVRDRKTGKVLEKNPLKEKYVRKAMSLVLNRSRLVYEGMGGYALPAHQFMPSTHSDYVPSINSTEWNIKKAKKYLEMAGYPDGFAVTLHHYQQNNENVLKTIKSMLADIGIDVTLQYKPVETFFDPTDVYYSMVFYGYSSFGTLSLFKALVETYDKENNQGIYNLGRYSNPKVDELLKVAAATFDTALYARTLRTATETIMDELPIIPIYHPVRNFVLRKCLSNPISPTSNTGYSEIIQIAPCELPAK